MTNVNADVVDAEIEATLLELADIMNKDTPLRETVRREDGIGGIQRAVHAIIRLQTRMHGVKSAAILNGPAVIDEATARRSVAEAIVDAAKDHAVDGQVRLTELIHIANEAVGR